MVIGFTVTAILSTLAFVSVFSVGFTIVLGSIIGFVGLHYFLWGWWLSGLLRDDEQLDSEA